MHPRRDPVSMSSIPPMAVIERSQADFSTNLSKGSASLQVSATPMAPPIQFGKHCDPKNRRVYVDPMTGRIDRDIYKLLTEGLKTELHIHQGGSTSVEFMIYSYRKAIMDGTILDYLGKDKSLPIYHHNGVVEQVSLVDKEGKLLPEGQLRNIMERVLTRENMREYLRVESINESQRSLIPNRELAETTADNAAQATGFDENYISKIKDTALNEYRVNKVKMTPFRRHSAAAYLVANMYAREIALENVRYAEYRMSVDDNNGTLNTEETLSAVAAGFEDAKAYLAQRLRRFDYGLVVLFDRQNQNPDEPPDARIERAKKLAQEVVRLKKEGKYNIVGVDLAGDEAHNPVTEFAEAFDIIKQYNASVLPDKRLGITIHAGETARSRNLAKGIDLAGWQSVDEAVRLGHDTNTQLRIGHGLQIINSTPILQQAFATYLEHPDDWEKRIDTQKIFEQSPLLKYVRDHGIVLEVCPKSNLQTYGIHPGFAQAQDDPDEKYTARSYKRHPAVFLSRLGVKIAVSGDNRTISNTDTPNEYVKLYKYAGLTYQDFKKMALDGFEGAFLPESQKAEMLKDVERHFQEMEKDPATIRTILKMDGKITWIQHFILLRDRVFDSLYALYLKLQEQFKPAPQSA